MAYSHKAMPQSYGKNKPLGHAKIKGNLPEMLSKRSQTQAYLCLTAGIWS